MTQAPGTILQHLYLRERLRRVQPGRFVEVGTGTGAISALLLELGWRGEGHELAADSVAVVAEQLAGPIAAGRYSVHHGDWLDGDDEPGTADLVLSSMVIEHLDDADVERYLAKARRALAPGGMGVVFVPASPEHWGIEDDIAGHFRRYTRETLTTTLAGAGFRVAHVAGLTYPVSNWLLPLSNKLVARAERSRLDMDMRERTERSGNRDVAMKTRFPAVTKPLLNPWTMRPLHALQKRCSAARAALVLYCEFRPTHPEQEQTPR